MSATCANCGDEIREGVQPVLSLETGDTYCTLKCKLRDAPAE